MPISAGDSAWVLVSAAMVFLMTPGLALFYGGMVRRKNVLNTLMSSFFVAGIGAVLWMLIGYSLSFSKGNGIIGDLRWFFLNGVGISPNSDYAATIPHNLFAVYQMMFAIITPALITGALVERMRFSTLVVFVAIWSLIVYYPMAHLLWSTNGFLHKLGAVDFAGGTVVHIVSGVSALLAAIMLGKRKGYGMASYHPHNIPLMFIGTGLLWFGWFGFNGGSALGANGIAVNAVLNTFMAGACAMVSWMIIEGITRGKATMLGAATGAVVGLASVTQGAGYIPLWAACVIGLVASPICYWAVTFLKNKLGFDDALDAFGCHGIGGIWGALATGLFAKAALNPAVKWDGLVFGNARLFLVQLLTIAVGIVLALVGTWVILTILKRIMPLRVSIREENEGLDISQHGESAYPSFTGLD